MDTIGRSPAILSTCVKRWCFYCMQSWLFASRSYEIRYGRPFSADRAYKLGLDKKKRALTLYRAKDFACPPIRAMTFVSHILKPAIARQPALSSLESSCMSASIDTTFDHTLYWKILNFVPWKWEVRRIFAMTSQCITVDRAIDLIFASDGSDSPAVGRLSRNDDFFFSSEEDELSSMSEGSFARECITIFEHVDMTVCGHILSLRWCPKKDFS